MSGARASVKLFAQAFDQNPCDLIVGIYFVNRRREKDLDALFFQQLAVAIELPRIFRQVFCGAKLGGVHENGNGNGVAPFCGADQRQVPFMQSAHRRNQTKAFAARACIPAGGASFRNGGTYFHLPVETRLAASPAASKRRPKPVSTEHRQGASRTCTSKSLRVPRSRARFLRRSAFVCSDGFFGTAWATSTMRP